MKRGLFVLVIAALSSCLLPAVDLRDHATGGAGGGGLDSTAEAGASGVSEPTGGSGEMGGGGSGMMSEGGSGAGGKGAGGSAGGNASSGADSGGASSGGTSTGGTGGASSAGASGASAGVSGGGAGGTSADGGAGGTSAGGGSSTAGSAGAGGGSAGAGGGSAGTGGGSAGAGGAPSLLPIVGSWDGALLTYACGTSSSGFDCSEPASAGCVATATGTPSLIPSSNGTPSSWAIGGTVGAVYDVTIRVRGVVEVNSYVGGTRDQGETSVLVSKDLFQRGGSPPAPGQLGFDYNTYELDVTPAVAGVANVYFLNSVTATENPHTSATTQHLTFPVDYTKTIKVPGGGQVQMKARDSNCVSVMNCGPTASNQCAAPRTVSLAGSTPPAPSTFVQPFSGQAANSYGEWFFFDITDVTLAQ